MVMEPPACMLHTWLGEEEGLVTHVSAIGHHPALTVFDGVHWLPNPKKPAGFYR
jgi:hypothetical protein